MVAGFLSLGGDVATVAAAVTAATTAGAGPEFGDCTDVKEALRKASI